MSNIEEAFNCNFVNGINLSNHGDIIDHFFTQRKVTEYEEFIDKNMNRKKKKKEFTYNFIAITVPYYKLIDSNEVNIEIKIWGDEGFKYLGTSKSKEGLIPSLLLKLNTDKQLFVNLKVSSDSGEENVEEKEYVTFINIPKRYQFEPTIKEN